MKKIVAATITVLMALTMTACGNNSNEVLPFSGIEPGMTIDEVKQAEPELVKEGDSYTLVKTYKDVVFHIKIGEEGIAERLTWTASSKENTPEDILKALKGIQSHCDKRYGKGDAGSIGGAAMMGWSDGTYVIDLMSGTGTSLNISVRKVGTE